MNLFETRVGQGVSGNLDHLVKNTREYNRKVDLIEYGVSIGLTFIDTAESYGNGISEEVIGQAIKSQREKVRIATKFSPENANYYSCLLYTSPSPRDRQKSRMPSSA